VDATPPTLLSASTVKAPTQSDLTFRLRFEFTEPIAWTGVLAAASASTGGGAAAAAAAAATAAVNATLQLTDTRLLNLTADAASAALMTFYLPAPSGGAGLVGVPVVAATAFEAWFEAPAGASATVVVPSTSYRDSAGNAGANDADVKVRGEGRRRRVGLPCVFLICWG